MPSPLIRGLAVRAGLPVLETGTVDAFLAPPPDGPAHALLFFTGDPAKRSESADVAVVLPELLAAFAGRLRAAIVSRAAESVLASRFHVVVMPSLVVTRGADPLAVLPRILDWSAYMAGIARCLEPDAPVLTPGAGPDVRIVRTASPSAAGAVA